MLGFHQNFQWSGQPRRHSSFDRPTPQVKAALYDDLSYRYYGATFSHVKIFLKKFWMLFVKIHIKYNFFLEPLYYQFKRMFWKKG